MPDRVRLGHAMRADSGEEVEILRSAVAIARGTCRLEARTPKEAVCVHGAEKVLGAKPPPIYAYVGDLNPALGVVGLIFHSSWFERVPQGISRCDTGGLYCGLGGFAAEPDEAVRRQLLRKLSSEQTCRTADWRQHFCDEIAEHHELGIDGYIEGLDPRYHGWADPRARFLEHADAGGIHKKEDRRRLWTWEARMSAPPTPDELETVVLSPQLAMHHDPEFLDEMFPDTVRVIEEDSDATGSHFFGPRTRAALLGEVA